MTADRAAEPPPLEGAAPLDDTECICASLAASDLRSLRWQREFGFDPLCPVDHDPRPEGAAPRIVPDSFPSQDYGGALHFGAHVEGAAPRADRITITPDVEGDARRIAESLNDMLHPERAAPAHEDERVR